MRLSEKRAFGAMFYYMEKYYFIDELDDIGALCGEINLLGDGMPADQAAWEDWEDALKKLKTEGHLRGGELTKKDSFRVMVSYLEDYYCRLKYEDLKSLLDELAVGGDGMPANPEVWDDWQVAVEKALNDERLEG